MTQAQGTTLSRIERFTRKTSKAKERADRIEGTVGSIALAITGLAMFFRAIHEFTSSFAPKNEDQKPEGEKTED